MTDSPAEASVHPEFRGATALGTLNALLWLAVAYPALYTLQAKVHGAAIGTLVVAAAVLLFAKGLTMRFQRVLLAPRPSVFVATVAILHGAVSALATYAVARTQPFSIDGQVYLFQARALSHGVFGAPMEFPRQFFSQRFLFQGADGSLHGVFPPGWPLFLAPWVRLGIPMLSGTLVAVFLSIATYILAKRLASLDADQKSTEWIARLTMLLSLPSFARAVETADLLSHAFVATLGAVAMVCALDRSETRSRGHIVSSLGMGLALGWAFSSRLLDGLLLATIAGVMTLLRSLKAPQRLAVTAALVIVGMLPGVALTAASQKQATGSWWTPTQTEYFRRSDYPASCHRLGFGADVGCYVEHGEERAIMGPGGYTLKRAFQVTRSRATGLSEDLLSPGFLLIVAFALAAMRPRKSTLFASSATVFFTLAYALFYYGNAPLFGARHLFPMAPFVYFLLASVSDSARLWRRRPDGSEALNEHVPLALAVAIFCALFAGHWQRWRGIKGFIKYSTDNELGVRQAIRHADYPSGIIFTPIINHAIGAYDPWTDHGNRVVVADNSAGLLDLRRAHPDWAVLMARPDATIVPTRLFELPPNLAIECESAWPSLQYPQGLQSGRALSLDYNRTIRVSGNQVLALTRSHPGASVHFNFDSVDEGVFLFEMGYVSTNHSGDYRVSLDGSYLFTVHGYGATVENRVVEAREPRVVTLGQHAVLVECIGKDPRSSGYDAALDILQARRPQ